MSENTTVSSLNGSDMPQHYDNIADVADAGMHTAVIPDAATGLPKRVAGSAARMGDT